MGCLYRGVFLEESDGRTKQPLLQFSVQRWQSLQTEALLCSFPGSILEFLGIGKGVSWNSSAKAQLPLQSRPPAKENVQ